MISMLYFIFLSIMPVSQEWTWSVHPESGFKVLSPVTLIHEVREVPTELDRIEYHQYTAKYAADSSQTMVFVIDHYILPSHDVVRDDGFLNEFFENTIDQLLTSIEGSLDYMDVIHPSGQDICIWKGNYKNGEGVIRGQCILSGNKYYGVQVFGLKINKPDATMTRFLDSFKLINDTSR